jgi:hypothetical protein
MCGFCATLGGVVRPTLFLSAFILASVTLCSSASAQRIVVGSPLDANFGGGQECTSPTGTWANSTLGEPGAHVSSPVDGTVIRWSMAGDYTANKPFELRILRPAAGAAYTGVGTSDPETPLGGLFSFNSFPTDLPIKAGDLIGINVNSGCVGVAGVTGSNYLNWFPALPDGSTSVAPYPGNDVEIGVSAIVQPPPTVTSLGSASSPLGGGSVVTIHGTDFEGATGVSFGGVPSPNFSVDYESQITAVVPPGARLGSVPVSVTTIAGTATAPQQLSYQACVVPSLIGRAPAVARATAGAANCAVGKVIRKAVATHKGAGKKRKKPKPKVIAQSRPAGTVLPVGAKIDLTVKG